MAGSLQRIAHRVDDQRADLAALAETHFGFRWMHIHIDAVVGYIEK